MGGCFSLIFGGAKPNVFANANRAKELEIYHDVINRMRTEEDAAKLQNEEESCMCAWLWLFSLQLIVAILESVVRGIYHLVVLVGCYIGIVLSCNTWPPKRRTEYHQHRGAFSAAGNLEELGSMKPVCFCCPCPCTGNPAIPIMEHHATALVWYWSFSPVLMLLNLCRPCCFCQPPIWFYERDVTMFHPPPPPGARDVEKDTRAEKNVFEVLGLCCCGSTCDACCCALCICCCPRLETVKLNKTESRFLKSLYCTLNGTSSCNAALCCGPGCATGDDQEQRFMKWRQQAFEERWNRTVEFFTRNYGVGTYEEVLSNAVNGRTQNIPVAVGVVATQLPSAPAIVIDMMQGSSKHAPSAPVVVTGTVLAPQEEVISREQQNESSSSSGTSMAIGMAGKAMGGFGRLLQSVGDGLEKAQSDKAQSDKR